MALKLSERKRYLAARRQEGRRVTIGFAGIADLRHFISLEYIKGMMKAACDYDINFINMGGAIKYSLFDDINFLSHYMKNFKFMKAPFLDGLVTWAATLNEFMDAKSYISLFSDLQPLPMVDIGHMDIPGATMLKIDSYSAVRKMMEHLINVHHYKRFAFIGTDISEPQRRRLYNYQHELERNGLEIIEGSVVMMNKKMEGRYIDEAADILLSRFDLHDRKSIDVIVTASDIIADEVIEELSRHGINVPGDVAVTGFNNWYESVVSRSPLTTIDLVYFKRGYAAVEQLIDKIVKPELPPETLYFPVDLVIRQSCGCLENSVEDARVSVDEREVLSNDRESEDSLRGKLLERLRGVFQYESIENVSYLIDCFFTDLYEKKERSRMLQWFQTLIQNYRKVKDFDCEYFQNAVSTMRSIFLNTFQNEDSSIIIHMENIFHQMRALVSVFQKYESVSERENPYRLNNISGQALGFLTVSNLNEVYEALRFQMGELDIPGAVLVLSERMSRSFPECRIEYIIPQPDEEIKKYLHTLVREPHLFPRDFFTKDKRYTVMLEVLYHGDEYFGYAFFEMKTPNLAIYDVLRMLLSNALYTVYTKEGRIKPPAFEMKDEEINNLFDAKHFSPDKKIRSRVNVQDITAYLNAHINEMTDIDKMAAHFMVSRSFLSRKCRELTGLSLQSLHEKIKIEQAKKMLVSGIYELSEIAAELGFKNRNYFSSVFKKNTGISPVRWRGKLMN